MGDVQLTVNGSGYQTTSSCGNNTGLFLGGLVVFGGGGALTFMILNACDNLGALNTANNINARAAAGIGAVTGIAFTILLVAAKSYLMDNKSNTEASANNSKP